MCPRCRGSLYSPSGAWTCDAHGVGEPLWSLPVSDRAAYVGKAGGLWLWLGAITWPIGEWMVLHDDLRLVDVRAPEHRALLAELPVALLSPHLAE